MDVWRNVRRPLLSGIGIRELCAIVLDYAYEVQGLPMDVDQPPTMSYVWGVALLTDDTFATAALTGEIFLWNLESGRKLEAFNQLQEDLQAIVSWNGRLVSASKVAVRVWESEACVSTLHTGHIDLMTTVGDWLVLATFAGFIKVLCMEGTKLESDNHAKLIVRVVGMDDKLVVCGIDSIDVYAIDEGTLTRVHKVLCTFHTAVCLDGVLVTWVEDTHVSVWGSGFDFEIPCEVIAACPLDRNRIAIACRDQSVGLYDVLRRTYTPIKRAHDGLAIVRLVQLADGRLAGHTRLSIFIWDLDSKLETNWPSTGYYITFFLPMGSRVLVCYDNPAQRVRIFE
jgi:WD40 repeat protein